jgi:hypothetical protein
MEKLCRAFGLHAEGSAGPATENPRVGGSIPPLATTSTSMSRMGFPASPADYRRARRTDFDPPSDFRKSGRSRAVRDGVAGRSGGKLAN